MHVSCSVFIKDFSQITVFDECSVDNGGCSHTCIDTVDSYRCECPPYEYMFFEGSVILYDFFLYEDGLRCMKGNHLCTDACMHKILCTSYHP